MSKLKLLPCLDSDRMPSGRQKDLDISRLVGVANFFEAFLGYIFLSWRYAVYLSSDLSIVN